MSKLEKLFNAMNLQIEENKTITKIQNGIKSTVQCNNKNIVTNITTEQLVLRNRSQAIVFNTHSKIKDCSYLFLEQHIHEILSLKIKLIISTILELIHTPSQYYEMRSQKLRRTVKKIVESNLVDFNNTGKDSLLNKWTKINENIEDQSFHKGLINLNYNVDIAYITNNEKVQYYKELHKVEDEECIFAYFNPYISAEFPLYKLLKHAQSQLLGIHLSKNERTVIKIIYQYIFEDIDKQDAYSQLNQPLLKDKSKSNIEKTYIVETFEEKTTPIILLIENFNILATSIDNIFHNINVYLVKNEKLNLNLTKDEIEGLKSLNNSHQNCNFGSINDIKKELQSKPRIKFEKLNNQINESLQKSNSKTTVTKSRGSKSRTNQNFDSEVMSSSFPTSNAITSLTILDPNNNSFEQVIPSKERKRNTHMIANSGAGKTTLMKTYIKKDLIEGNTIVVMDPDGDFAEEVAKMIDDPSKLIFIDPYLDKSQIPTINPLQVMHNNDENMISSMTQELVVAFENGIGLEWSVNMEATLYPCISTLIRANCYTIYDLQRFMNNEYNRDLIELGKKSPIKAHREFFRKQFHQEKLDTTKDALETKLQVLLNDPVFSNLITGDSTINLEKEINTKGKVIIFKLSLGEMVSTLTLYSRLIMALIQGIIFRRKRLVKEEIPETHLYLDEFQHFVSPSIETMLTQSRKKKCYTTLAHQTISGQLNNKMKDIVASCTHYKLAGQNSYDNHRIMCKALQVEIDVLQNLENGCFISKVGASPYVTIKYSDKFIGDNASVLNNEKWNGYLEYQIEKYYRIIKDESLESELNSHEIKLTPKSEEF